MLRMPCATILPTIIDINDHALTTACVHQQRTAARAALDRLHIPLLATIRTSRLVAILWISLHHPTDANKIETMMNILQTCSTL
jgi:hypothetical protein